MIDTHAHLNFPELLNQIETVVNRSKEAGLTGIIIASSNLADSKKAIELAREYPGFLWASVGIHPQKTDPQNQLSPQEQLRQLEELIAQAPKSLVAIGETGLDFGLPAPGEKERSHQEQEELFRGQIKLAFKYDLPLIIHARQANDEVIEVIEREINNWKLETIKLPRGVFHCYSGGKKRIEKILNLPGDWYFGVDGNLTYDPGLQRVVAQIPREKLLLETDAPFLAPQPYRGQTCYPEYLPLIAAQVAEIWSQSVNDVKKQILSNVKKLFEISV